MGKHPPIESLYDRDSGMLSLFLFKVQQRSMKFGWTSILMVNQAGQVYNLFESYGQVTITSIRAQTATVKAANSRDTQNSSQMYDFLIGSLTDGMLAKVMLRRETFTLMTGFQDGPSLLNIIVAITHMDASAEA
jgi:hypothetical protein